MVETASQNTAAELAPVFVEANLDQTSVYVQAQALLSTGVDRRGTAPRVAVKA